ncbi:hypothetical protein AVEN_254314-1 [Araneus ventricosus]|uniref:Tc1-like transposase DDE domain-containing protein n=1 Tax=Araneus ventricosus TaxID=182803 RepID=A0A4Y2TVY3_ARAVE|nr:hypothetical protein AVEN_254314-1 [Araneus ventricosus]
MPHHRTDSVFDANNIVFGTRVIAYQYTKCFLGAFHWPPISPDLNPCAFFLWCHMKDLEYKKKPTDFISLKRFITDSFASIKRKTLQLLTDNFVTRLRYCITCDGSHFENILH